MKDYIHKEFPKTCAPDDFLGQIKRTINGKPVSQEQIDMILQAIKNGLKFSDTDFLLDLCCGNGVLSQCMFNDFSKYLGVDFSEYLIEVAKNNFEKLPNYEFMLCDAATYLENEKQPQRFTKALCYGAFQYLSFEDAEETLKLLNQKFKNIKRIFIGNLPDKDKAHLFYKDKNFDHILADRDSSIGIWRTKDEMAELCKKTGWNFQFSLMPESFYASHYRFDIILKRE